MSLTCCRVSAEGSQVFRWWLRSSGIHLISLRPALRGEEPAAREPGFGGLGVTGIAESNCDGMLDAPMLAETTSPLYCAPKC
jgi:hypothetical protein